MSTSISANADGQRDAASHAKSTISYCTPSVITRQQALRAIFKTHIYLYVHAVAKAPLGRFVADI